MAGNSDMKPNKGSNKQGVKSPFSDVCKKPPTKRINRKK